MSVCEFSRTRELTSERTTLYRDVVYAKKFHHIHSFQTLQKVKIECRKIDRVRPLRKVRADYNTSREAV